MRTTHPVSRTRRTGGILAAVVAVMLIAAPAALAWPQPPRHVPPAGVDVCVPTTPAGSFTVEHVTDQARLTELRHTTGTHVAEHGTCEGPVVTPPPSGPPVTPPAAVPLAPATPVVAPPVVKAPCPTCACPPTTCVSNRVYVFHIRPTYLGRRVVGVRAVQQGLPALTGGKTRTTVKKVTRGRDHRRQYQVTVNYRGLEFPKGQVRSTTVYLKLGKRAPGALGDDEHVSRAGWFLTQELNRNCMAANGTLNRDTAQPNPIRVPAGQVPR